jgi:hypothetical protein
MIQMIERLGSTEFWESLGRLYGLMLGDFLAVLFIGVIILIALVAFDFISFVVFG